MPNPNDNKYQIPTLTSTTTFYDWVNHYNQNVVGKLNNIKIYDGVSGDGVNLTLGTTASNDPQGGATTGSDLDAGVFRVTIADTVNKGVTFYGDVSVNGELKFSPDLTEIPNTRFRVYGQTAGFTFGQVVRCATGGITYAQANGQGFAEAIGIVAGITFSEVDTFNPTLNYIEIATAGVVEGVFKNTDGATLSPGCSYFLSAEDPGGLTASEPIVSGQVSKPMVVGVTYDDISGKSKAVVVNYRGQYLSTGLSGSVAGATANSNMFTVQLEGANNQHTITPGKVVGFRPGTGFNGWFEFTNNYENLEHAIGVCVNKFEFGGQQYIQVIGSGLIDNYNNINSSYGLQYIGVDGLLTGIPPGGAAKPFAFVWEQGGDFKAFVINQQYTGEIEVPDGAQQRSAGARGSGGGGFANNYRLGNNSGATYGQAIQPNLLINGGYDIWQRGIGTLPYGNTGNTYLADKWLRIDGITAKEGTGKQAATYSSSPNIERVPFAQPVIGIEGDPTYYLRTKHSISGYSGPAGDHVYLVNRIENNETLAGEDVTLSFYAKCGVTGSTMGFVVSQYDGTSKRNTPIGTWMNGATYNDGLVRVGTQWQKYSVAFTVPSVSTTSSDSYVDVGFDVTNTNSQLDLAQVKLERGYVPTVFEPTDLRLELDKCKRYYQRSYALDQDTHTQTMTGGMVDPTALHILASPSYFDYYRFPIEMRRVPKVNFFSPESGHTGDAFNASANADMRLTSGSQKDGSTRSAPGGVDTVRFELITNDGFRVFLNSGLVLWDDIHLHYVADADFLADDQVVS